MDKSFKIKADGASIAVFRSQLKELATRAGLDEKASGEVILAVQEALTNIVRHAYQGKSGTIEVRFKDCADRIEVSIRDHGKKFNPEDVPEPVLPPTKPGGLGVYLIKTLMDRVEYDASCKDGNHLILTKNKQV